MNENLFEYKDIWKEIDTQKLGEILPSYFGVSDNIESSAYLNWRFGYMHDPEIQFYEMGKAYFETAIKLIDYCLEDNRDNKADIWIFPILFNVIHGMEVYLKGFNSQIRILDKIEKQEYQESKIEGKHNILQLCQTAISLIKCSSQKELLVEFKFIKKFIDILYLNTNDMTFARYPIDSDKKPHFYIHETENFTIDLDVLRIWICKIFNILDTCTGFVDFQIDQIKDWLYEMQQEYGE